MLHPEVRNEQIRTLFRQSPSVLIANVVNSAIVATVLWRRELGTALVLWFTSMLIMAGVRAVHRARYLKSPNSAADAARHGRRFVAGSVTAGALWGGAGWIFYDPQNPLSQFLLLFVIGGMAAAAAGTLCVHLPAFFGFALPALLPVAGRMLIVGDPTHLATSLIVVGYIGGLSYVANTSQRTFVEAFRLRFENEALLRQLSEAQVHLEQANLTLEQRIAERTRTLEQQGLALREAQRLEWVGKVAGGVAHDFNNLLSVVLGNASFLASEFELPERARAALKEIGQAATRGAELVRQLLAASQKQHFVLRVFDLNERVLSFGPLLQRFAGERIRLKLELADGPLPVRADVVQIEQVLMNLVANAKDAMVEGGLVTVQTALDADHVVLRVRDTGTGMDTVTLARAFEPFFTTKPAGRGTGLGLSTVRGIVEQTGGQIHVTSELGRGTCCEVRLPRASGPVEDVSPARTPAPTQSAPRTILLAEDEKPVRSVLERLLRREGHRVLVAEDGQRALDVARSHSGPIHLLVTDVTMPRLNGPELARALRAERAELGVLFISGYSFDQSLPPSDPEARIAHLPKPFDPDTLLREVAVLTRAS
ncbi:MAG TPA: ATP-binding protein [Polyangiaceae bacterium]|nr:ATP-binding protein [Polyangiaceae bacterium]